MANSNCNCAMSLIQKQCPRITFDCHRCFHRMKNAGSVWGVDHGSLVAPLFDGSGSIEDWPDTITPLYYDKNFLSTGTPDGTSCYSAVIALNNWSDSEHDGAPVYLDIIPSVQNDDQTLRLTLYFDGVWKLQLIWTIYIFIPVGEETVVRAIGSAMYKSGQSGCGSEAGDSMDLLESEYHELYKAHGVPSEDGDGTWPQAPETITFKLIPNPFI